MDIARRLYIYGVAAIGLAVLAVGLIRLLSTSAFPDGDPSRGQARWRMTE